MICMMLLYYFFMGCHWWCNYEFGITDAESSTLYHIFVFIFALCVIGVMLYLGAGVNRKKLTHEFYQEKISEEKQRIQEEQAKAAQKAENAAKMAELGVGKK